VAGDNDLQRGAGEPGPGATPETVAPSRGQKIGIWIVGGYFVLEAAAGLVSMFLLAGGAVPVPDDTMRLINSMPQPLFFAGFVSMFLSLSGGVFLLMRRRLALSFLLGGAVAKLAGDLLTSRAVQVTATTHAVAMVAEWVLLVVALAYVAMLWRRRVLAP